MANIHPRPNQRITQKGPLKRPNVETVYPISATSTLEYFSVLFVPYPFYCIEPIININYRGRARKRIIQVMKENSRTQYGNKYLFGLVIRAMLTTLTMLGKGSRPANFEDSVAIKFFSDGIEI